MPRNDGPDDRTRDKRQYPDRRHPFHFDAETYREQNSPMLVTVCTKDRAATLTGDAADIVVDALLERARRFQVRIYAYCVMPDHLHFFATVSPEGGEFEKFMRGFKSEASRLINKAKSKGTDRFQWQRSCWDTFTPRREDVRREIAYMLGNPVRKGLCDRTDEWRYTKVLDWPQT